jgi:phenylacetate-CoA ligase
MKLFATVDRLPLADIKKVQERLLLETLHQAYEASPYYRRLFNKYRLVPSRIKGLEQLQRLPFTTKADIQKDNWAFLAVRRQDIAEVVSTTGTTGEPVFVALTNSDLERLAYNEEKSFSCAGVDKEDLFHIAVTCDNLFIAGIAYYSGLLRLGVSVVRIGPQNIFRHLELIKKILPTGIIAVPSFMVQLSKRATESGLDPKSLGLKKIVLIGDSIRNVDFRSNALGGLIETSFGDICYSTYGITEGQLSFCECQTRQGLHSHPELVIVEVVDEDGRPLPDGELGELVITTLQVVGMPLIRYKTGDITFKISELCSCGRNSIRIGPILGRKHLLLKIKGVTLYPKTIENAVLGISDVLNYQVEAYTGEDDYSDHIILRIGSYRNDKEFKILLKRSVKAKARVTPDIVIESPEDVQKRLFEGGSRKPIIFKDSRRNIYE